MVSRRFPAVKFFVYMDYPKDWWTDLVGHPLPLHGFIGGGGGPFVYFRFCVVDAEAEGGADTRYFGQHMLGGMSITGDKCDASPPPRPSPGTAWQRSAPPMRNTW